MTHRHRRYIFWSFVVIFFITTFFIFLYAAGYRLNLTWPLQFNQLLQKNGAIFLGSEPSNANVQIIDKTPQRIVTDPSITGKEFKTPAKLKSVLPGNYEVKIELEGYWPIIKTINVYPGETTYLENIYLFRQNLPLKVLDAKLQNIELTSDGNHLILNADKKIINLKSELEENVLLTSNPLINVPDIVQDKFKSIKYYSPINSNEFLYADDFSVWHFDINQNQKALVARSSEALTGIIWQKDNYLIYSTEKNINIVNLNGERQFTRLISLEKIMPPVLNAAGDTLYFTAKLGQQEALYKLFIK
ncbi:MAG: PEGA domain-containing protein [Candidatus Falkowbacteria bacterium]